MAAALALSVLTGCSGTGDFGRVRRSLAYDGTHDWMGPAATGAFARAPWQHQLTDEERRLRDLAYPLIEPPYERQRWYSAITENGYAGAWPTPDRAAYASRLFQTAYRSQTGRYNRLIEDIRNDGMRIDAFYAAARYVRDMDKRREKSLAYVTGLSREEETNTINRIRENEAVTRWVGHSLRERALSYQLALERLVIAAPSQMAIEAERAIKMLDQRLVQNGA